MKDHTELPDEYSLALAAAYGVLEALDPLWVEYFKMGTSEEFTEYVGAMVEMPDTSGDAMARIVDRMLDSPADELAVLLKKVLPDIAAPNGKPLPPHIAKIRVIELGMLDVACLFVVQAVKAEVDKAPEKELWSLSFEARRRLGMLQGYILGNQDRTEISALAKLGADATHRVNRATRQQAYEWLDENLPQFKSQTAAAEALGKIVPMEFSTRLDYVKTYKKMVKQKSD